MEQIRTVRANQSFMRAGTLMLLEVQFVNISVATLGAASVCMGVLCACVTMRAFMCAFAL